MTQSLPESPELLHAFFEKSCTYCGALFNVELTRQGGNNPVQPFACPECTKRYEVRSAKTPKVRLVSARTDGKTDDYQETMF